MKQKFDVMSRGGGLNNSLNASFSTKDSNNSKKFFKPLVASSLALFLSANIASALDTGCTTSNDCTPITSDITFRWIRTSSDSNPTSSYDPSSNTVSLGKDITAVTLSDTEFANSQFNFPGHLMYIDFGKDNAYMDYNRSFTLNATKAFAGNLKIDFGIGSDRQRTFTLDAKDTFTGNIEVFAGKGDGTTNETKNSKFSATFAKDVTGNITLDYTSGKKNAAGHKNEITFSDGASLKGNLSASAGTNTIIFENGNVEGNISASAAYSSWATANNTITFNKAGSITGNVSATGGGKNTITFANGTTNNAVGEISAGQSGSGGGSNIITFNNTSGTNKVASVKAQTSNYSGDISNVIDFAGDSSSVANTITGNIEARGDGSDRKPVVANTITFANGTNKIGGAVIAATTGKNTINVKAGSLTIAKGVEAKEYSSKEIATNTITVTSGDLIINNLQDSSNSIASSHSNTKNIIKISSGTLTTEGGISAVGTNEITVAGQTTIGGNVVANGGSNTINVTSGGLEIAKGMSTSTYGATTNDITVNSGNLNVGTLDTGAGNGYSVYLANGNNVTNITLDSGNLTTQGGIGNVNGGKVTIELKAGSANIGGNIIAAAGATNAITIGTATAGVQSKADSIANTITGSISTTGASKNTITVNSGGLSIAQGVKTTTWADGSGHGNQIEVKSGKLSIGANADGYAVYASEGGNSNTITATAGGSITGNIFAGNSGTNNIKLSQTTTPASFNLLVDGDTGSSNVSDLANLKGNITTSGGSNNIVFENTLWAPAALLSNGSLIGDSATFASGKVTTTGGTTNLVVRQEKSSLPQGTTAIYDVVTSGGTANIVMQGPVNVGANVDYGTSGTTNFIFASSNDSADDSFSNGSTATNNNNSKVLGKTYQDGVKLSLADKQIQIGDSKNQSFLNTYGKYFEGVADSGLLTLTTDRTNSSGAHTDNINVKGLALGTISELTASASGGSNTYTYNVNLDKNSAFVGNISLQANSNVNITMDQSSKLLTDSNHLHLQKLTIEKASFDNTQLLLNTFEQTNTVIDLATMGSDFSNIAVRSDFRLLEIGSAGAQQADPQATGNEALKGSNALFRVYANADANSDSATLGGKKQGDSDSYGYAYADRIIIHSADTTANNQNIQILLGAGSTLSDITYKGQGTGTETAGNVAVATVKNDSSGNASVIFHEQSALQGFDEITSSLVVNNNTDQYGKANSSGSAANAYTTYFIGSVGSKGASLANQQASAAALGTNYDLYLANMNSLNKRMGELRNNANSQGAWARIFNGMQTSKFSLETKAIYTTIQAGYDYAFGFEGANNYVGVALSYANSITTSSTSSLDIDGSFKGIKDTTSNAIEFAIYNAYVQDGASKGTKFKNGLYSDSILKFSYIMSNLSMLNQSDTYNTNNFAFTLSQELGYRFLLGDSKEWIIDPQVEVAFGYLNQSNLKQKLGTAYLDGIQDSIITLRSRIGSSFGYDFKKFTEDKGFNAKVYLGTYFVGDYIAGGNVSLTSNLGTNVSLAPLASTARFVMNVGSNFSIKENHRIYFDFERSFGGLITTDYQVNLGYRYSFGASKYTPYNEVETQALQTTASIKEITPTKGYYVELLKVTEKPSKKQEKILKQLEDKLKTQSTTEDNKTLKTYLVGPFNNQEEANNAKTNDLAGSIKELNSSANIIEVE